MAQDDMKTVVLGELPLAEKERFFEFLVANKVEFVAEDESNFVATIKVVPPELSTARINGRVMATSLNRSRSTGATGVKHSSQGGSRAALPGPVQDVQATVRAAQVCLRKRYRRFCQLLPAMSSPPKALTKAAILRFAEDLYEDRFERDCAPLMKLVKEGEAIPELQGFPEFVFEFCKHRYGLKQVVSNNCWGLVSSIELLRGQHIGIETLGRFMEVTFDAEDLIFFLSLRIAVEKILSSGNSQGFVEDSGVDDDENARNEKHAKARAARDEKTNRKKQVFQNDRLDPKQCIQIVRIVVSSSKSDLRDAILKQVDYAMARTCGSDGARRSPSLEPERLMYVALDEYHNVRMKNMPPPNDDEWMPEIVKREPEPPPLPKDKELEPGIRKQVKVVAGKLYTSLAESGGGQINRQAVQEWAMQVVLRRNKTGEYMDDFPQEDLTLADLDEMNSLAEKWRRPDDAVRPSSLLQPIDDVLGLSPEEFEMHLETNIRQLLLSATSDVVNDAIDQSLGDDTPNVSALHAALMAQYAPVADLLMESVVGRDFNAWLQALQIEGSGHQRHKQAFHRLHDEFKDVVSTQIDAEAVLHICRGITSAEEFCSLIRNRAVVINRSGLPGYGDSDEEEEDQLPAKANVMRSSVRG